MFTHNFWFTSKKTIINQLQEKRPLPIGMTEFEEWSERIISGAGLPATPESLKFCLADMLLHLSPTEAFKEDGYFINCLRKFAVNQIADAKRTEIRDTAKARLAAEEAARQASKLVQPNEVTSDPKDAPSGQEILANAQVQKASSKVV